MPPGFSEEERGRIEARLVEVGREHFRRLGLRRTNIAQLAASAGIGKGSFYLFFPSKEALFLAVHVADEPAIRAAFTAELATLRATPLAMVKRYFTLQLEILRELPMMQLLSDPAELASLMRKLSPAEVATHLADDQSWFVDLLRTWEAEGLIGGADLENVAAISRALVAMNLHRDLIGEERFAGVVDLLVSGVAASLVADPVRLDTALGCTPSGPDDEACLRQFIELQDGNDAAYCAKNHDQHARL